MENTQKAIEFLKQNRVLHLATVSSDGGASTRAMFLAEIEDDLSLWFGTAVNSNKVAEIAANPSVCVSSFEKGTSFRAFGSADIVNDQEIKTRIWRDEWTHYFPQGATDPNFALIRVNVTKTEFYEMSHE